MEKISVRIKDLEDLMRISDEEVHFHDSMKRFCGKVIQVEMDEDGKFKYYDKEVGREWIFIPEFYDIVKTDIIAWRE